MSIPDTIKTDLAALQAQVAAASPLANASFSTIKAMQLNAGNLVDDVQSALTGAKNLLDTWVPPVDPQGIVAGFDTVVVQGQDQSDLALMRGIVGRVSANLDRLV